jgi:transposase InsO family protein
MLARTPALWPCGRTGRISVATLYRWINVYLHKGLDALRPARRRDAGKLRASVPDEVVSKARALFTNDPDISFTFVLELLKADPILQLQQRSIVPSRSTLQRRLAADPAYAQLKRARKLARRRGRFIGRHVHDIWHLDAKGPVKVRLTNGEHLHIHVLTVLDNVSRAVLAGIIVLSPNLGAAVRVFRLAARRWGLPNRIYMDRASIFDSAAFRSGLAELGIHRIRARSKNPQANGKIEAYHRSLAMWFTLRLARQGVVDLEHLQQLHDAYFEVLYQDHRHRSLSSTPRLVLAGKTSERQVTAARLDDAFREERTLKAHRTTGEVDLAQGTYLVPDGLRGQRLKFLLDPERSGAPVVIEPGTGRHLPLKRAAIGPSDCALQPPANNTRWAEGPLQTLYDSWQGQTRPVAEPGFGLPEIFELLALAVGRPVPRSDSEAALVHRAYRAMGPLGRRATETAFRAIRRALGDGRPVQSYLEALAQRIKPSPAPKPKKRSKKR